jgi:hypothetical protein
MATGSPPRQRTLLVRMTRYNPSCRSEQPSLDSRLRDNEARLVEQPLLVGWSDTSPLPTRVDEDGGAVTTRQEGPKHRIGPGDGPDAWHFLTDLCEVLTSGSAGPCV